MVLKYFSSKVLYLKKLLVVLVCQNLGFGVVVHLVLKITIKFFGSKTYVAINISRKNCVDWFRG